MKLLFTILLIVIFLSDSVNSVNALTVPEFPACSNPKGQIKSSYENGIHGIVGDSTTYSGKDTVYTLSENTLTQCLCTDNGRGIQTNWWKATGLTQDEINVLLREGWIPIADGFSWGLDNSSYIAKNSDYSCASSGVGGISDVKSQGASAQSILSLASTGNITFIAAVFLVGIALLGSGLALSFKKRG